MKRLLALTVIACMALCSLAEEYKFPPEVIELIEKYEGTRPAVLPNPKKMKEEEDRFSCPPARLNLPVNIIINKRTTRLYVVNVFGDTLDTYRVCCSANRGQKTEEDDSRTPEGTFKVVGIYNSTDWRYKKVGEKCYGPYFISLLTPGFYGIGIHGTNAPGSIPGRHSHGCIRMHNEDIKKVRKWVNRDTKVTILPDDVKEEKEISKRIREEYVPPTSKR